MLFLERKDWDEIFADKNISKRVFGTFESVRCNSAHNGSEVPVGLYVRNFYDRIENRQWSSGTAL